MENLHPGVVLVALLAVVPLQYYLSPSHTSDIKFYLQQLADSVMKKAVEWKIELPGLKDRYSIKDLDEFVLDKSEIKHFAGSPDIRTRAPGLLFRVGDVVRHKEKGYRSVVVGWDLTAQAPEQWLERVHAGNPHWTSQPNYAILVDERDRAIPQLAYVPQERLEYLEPKEPVNHFLMKHYFERYDHKKGKYIAKPFIKKSYPDD